MSTMFGHIYEGLLQPTMYTTNFTAYAGLSTPTPQISQGVFGTIQSSSYYHSSLAAAVYLFSSIWSLITIWRVVSVLLICLNLKNAPFVWTLRIVNAFRFCTKTMRPEKAPTSANLFQPLITSSKPPLSEIDIYMHKSNSTYFSDLDIARTHLVCTLFSRGIEHIRGGTSAINGGGTKKPFFGVALGAVSCNFKRELKPYEAYDMWTRVLTFDEKWIYILTHFVKQGSKKPETFTLYPEQEASRKDSASNSDENTKHQHWSTHSNKDIVATGLSKCVFKAGRRTISPMLMMKYSELLPADSIDEAVYTSKEYYQRRDSIEVTNYSGTSSPRESRSSISTDSGIDCVSPREVEDESLTEMERIELKRQKGMKAARVLSSDVQGALDVEFEEGEESALGLHTDGAGIVGVVSTLAKLAGLKKHRVL